MYVAIRSYSGQGASELFDALASREQDVKALISTVPGFISYEAFRNNGGGQTVTVAQDKAGTILVLDRIENDVYPVAVVTDTRKRRGDRSRPAKFLRA